MLKAHILRVLIGALFGAFFGVAYWAFAPKLYSSTASVFINSAGGQSVNSTSPTDVLALGASQSIGSETSILQSEGVFRSALRQVAVTDNRSELADEQTFLKLYPMYEVDAARESRVLQIRVFAYSPSVAADMANAIVDVYNGLRKDTGKNALAGAESTVRSELAQTSTQLASAEERLRQFKEANKVIDLPVTASQIATYQASLTQSLDAARAESRSADSEMAQQRKNLDSLPKRLEMGTTEVRPIVQQLETQVAGYETQRTEALRHYALTSQKIAQIDALIADTNARLTKERQTAWQTTAKTVDIDPRRMQVEQALIQNEVRKSSAESRIRSLSAALAVQNSAAAKLPAKEQQFAQLTRDAEVFRSSYARIKAQLEDVALKQTSEMQQATLLYPGLADDKPASPQFSKAVPFAALFGCLLALMFSLARESMRRTAASGQELAELVELPIAAAVPRLTNRAAAARFKSLPTPGHSPLQAFRYLAASATLGTHLPRTVVFTSVGGESGCSSAATEFAVAAAKMGTKTLLVDADFRFGTSSNLFGHRDATGLSDMLTRDMLGTGDSSPLVGTSHAFLSMLTAGTERALFVTDRSKTKFDGVMAFVRESADLVVIDCPPIDIVADTVLFVPYADEVYLVVTPREATLQAVAVARDLIEQGGGKKTSLLLTQVTDQDIAFPLRNRYLK